MQNTCGVIKPQVYFFQKFANQKSWRSEVECFKKELNKDYSSRNNRFKVCLRLLK
jgi:hypothetical protein